MHFLIIGGSDAGSAAGLRVHELDPTCDITLVLKLLDGVIKLTHEIDRKAFNFLPQLNGDRRVACSGSELRYFRYGNTQGAPRRFRVATPSSPPRTGK
jgi:hypothetical protein